jgi:hypothetical protein
LPVAVLECPDAVRSSEWALLDGSKSYDPMATKLLYSWKQTGGDVTVTIENPSGAEARFLAPDVTQSTALTFTLEVNNGDYRASGECVVSVVPESDDTGISEADIEEDIARPDATGDGDIGMDAVKPAPGCGACMAGNGITLFGWHEAIGGLVLFLAIAFLRRSRRLDKVFPRKRWKSPLKFS